MSYPVFNFDYQDVYSTSVEFKTQINEKHLGKEQRYPVWTYPKRTFTLTFDKKYSDREDIEDFFIALKGAEGLFTFVWDTAKGGNGKTYLCSFDNEVFSQNIFDYGFSESQLTFSAIDDSVVSPPETFDFWHNADSNFDISFDLFADANFTARNDKKSYWTKPKRKWTLHFQKKPEIRKQIEDFFIAKRGKFRSFQWVWDSERGGDGKTYNVRFDTDKLDFSVLEYGFSEFSVDIVEVFPTQNYFSEVEKDEIIPRKLLKIELAGGSVYILDNETLESYEYNNETYIGAPLSFGEIRADDNSAVNKLEVELSNVSLAISGIIGNRGDVITGAPAVLTLVFLNVNTNQLINGLQKILYCGKCNNLSLNFETAKIDIETELGGYEKLAPVIKYRPTCQVRRFKDVRCGYSGAETVCDRTFARCQQLGNTANFRGFPSCVLESVIKV